MLDGTEETSSGVSELESLQESIIEDLSTDPAVRPMIATGKRRIGGSILNDYQGASDLVQKLRASREQIEGSLGDRGNLKNLKQLAVLLSRVAEMQAEQAAQLEEEIYDLTTETNKELHDFIADSKKREESLRDLLATAKDLEEAVLKNEPYVTACYLRRAVSDAQVILAQGFSSMYSGFFSFRNTIHKHGTGMMAIRWTNFKAEVVRLLRVKAEINIARKLDGEGYRATLVRLGEPDIASNRVDVDIEATEVEVGEDQHGGPVLSLKFIEDATLPAILQFFISNFVLEVIRRRIDVVQDLNDLAFLKEYKQKKDQTKDVGKRRAPPTAHYQLPAQKKQRIGAKAHESKSSKNEPFVDETVTKFEKSFVDYITLLKCTGLLLNADVLHLLMPDNKLHLLLNSFAHASENARIEGLPELSVESVGRIFSDEKIKQAYDAKDSDKIPVVEFTAVKPALDRLFKAMRIGYRAQDSIPLKEDIAAFVSKQKNEGTKSVISRADLKILEKLLLAEGDSNVEVREQGSEEGRVPAAKGKGKAVA